MSGRDELGDRVGDSSPELVGILLGGRSVAGGDESSLRPSDHGAVGIDHDTFHVGRPDVEPEPNAHPAMTSDDAVADPSAAGWGRQRPNTLVSLLPVVPADLTEVPTVSNLDVMAGQAHSPTRWMWCFRDRSGIGLFCRNNADGTSTIRNTYMAVLPTGG